MSFLNLADLSEDLAMIVESTRAVVPGDGALTRIRALRFASPGFDPAMMRSVAEAGWPFLRVSEKNGGLGLGAAHWCTLMQVLGAGLVPEPVLSNVLGCALLRDAVPEAVPSGDAVLVTAWQDRPNSLEWVGGAGNGALSGTKNNVPGAAGADLFAVVTGKGVALVSRDAPGLAIATDETLDGCQTGTLTFSGTPAVFQAAPDTARLLDEAVLAQAAYLLGLMERAFEITLDYLRVREQFDRAIGSFQALQHRATEIRVQLDLLRASVMAAAGRIDLGQEESARQRDVSRCKRRASEMALHVAGEVVQMHGAIGITDEADIGLFVRKAMTEASQFGSARVHRARLAHLLEADA